MFEQGDLILIPYPFTDLSAQKKRPVLVLSKPDEFGDFIALPVTSRTYHKKSLPIAGQLINGDLPKESWVRTDHIVTLNQSLVIKSFATCSMQFVSSVLKELCDYIEYNITAKH
jgi:mRNA interferase MazF